MSESYTLKELIESCDVSGDTVRYYEKIGLLPTVERRTNGHRVYQDIHKQTLLMIKCLKKAGMSLKELEPILLLQQDDSRNTGKEWDKMLLDYQKKIEQQQKDLQKIWNLIEEKRQSGIKWGTFS